MKLILISPNSALCDAWKQTFADLPNVEVTSGYFQYLKEYDCMVSAANSFGLMDGGVDGAITDFFGVQLMQRVQQHIIEYYQGEQPVGTSFIIETHHLKHPFLAHSPTMRVPIDISKTDHVYQAMWATLLAVHRHNETQEQKINSLAIPGFGTGTGRVPYKEAARQMALAYRNYLNPPQEINWNYAILRNLSIEIGIEK